MRVAQDLWEDIQERLSIANRPHIQQLKAELVKCKQRGLSIVAYYGKMKKLWGELANYEQIPTCKCGLCKCRLEFLLKKKYEKEKVHQFLMGLDETLYRMIRSNILAQDPLLSLNKVYSILVQEKRVRTISHRKEERGEVMSFTMHTGLKSRGRGEGKDKNITCNNCNRIGHESDICFELIGNLE